MPDDTPDEPGVPDASPAGPRGLPPRALLAVAAVLGLEAVALGAAAGYAVVGQVRGDTTSGGLVVGVVVVAVGVAVVLVLAGRALLAGRRWGRAPALTWQLLQLTVAVPALLSSVQPLPAVLLAASLVVVAGLFRRSAREWTTIGGTPPTL